MQSTTHITSSLSLSLIPFYIEPNVITSIETIPYFLGGIAIGSLFPDIDEPNSSIGRKTIVISHLINFIFKHRGLTHKFIFFLSFLFLAIVLKEQINKYVYVSLYAFSFGILFHQIGDMLSGSEYNKGGIKDYFFPITTNGKYFTPFPKILRCKVGDWKEKIYNVMFTSFFLYELYSITTTLNLFGLNIVLKNATLNEIVYKLFSIITQH